MKTPSYAFILLISTHACLQAGQNIPEIQMEGIEPRYQQMLLDRPAVYENEPGVPVFIHESEIRESHAKTLCLKLIATIYQDRSIKEQMQSKYPALTAKQLLMHTRQEKEAQMDRQGLALLQSKLPEAPFRVLEANAQTYKNEFFSQQTSTICCEACACCCYKNYSDDYRAGNIKQTKWNFDEPNCCGKFWDKCIIQ